ncbi:MAG: hypothetical protein ACKVOL_12570 [Novosphingobium sp.]
MLATEQPATREATAGACDIRKTKTGLFTLPYPDPELTGRFRPRGTVTNGRRLANQTCGNRSPDLVPNWRAAYLPGGFSNTAIAGAGRATPGDNIG